MHFIIVMFWIGLFIILALAIVNLVFTVGLGLVIGIFAGLKAIWDKLTHKNPVA